MEPGKLYNDDVQADHIVKFVHQYGQDKINFVLKALNATDPDQLLNEVRRLLVGMIQDLENSKDTPVHSPKEQDWSLIREKINQMHSFPELEEYIGTLV